jgi:S1-C subfamily serine protease
VPLSAVERDRPRVATTLSEAEAALAQLVTVRRGDGTTVARGSAFFVDAMGHLLTCAHVLDHMPKDEAPRLRLADGRTRRFRVVRVDEETDLALLLSDPPERFLPLDEPSRPQAGQAVLLAGFAAGADVAPGSAPRFKRAVVLGLERRWASGPRRSVRSRRRVVTVKVDQTADRGQSGGPLLAADELTVLGVVRANLEPATGGLGGSAALGYGAAVPLMYVKPFLEPPN